MAVQNTEHEVGMVNRIYRSLRGSKPAVLREDFCGTSLFCCDWVRHRRENRAFGVDLSPETLAWGEKHNLSLLSEEQRGRVRPLLADVRDKRNPEADVIVAFNFSYFIFKTREDLRGYFRLVRQKLRPGGVFMMDAYGGSEAHLVLSERRKCDGFTYVWEHASYNPLTAGIVCKIHFEFSDGSKMRNAFVYDWRLWSLVEIRELLAEAGFSNVDVYWEGTTKEGEGDGVFRKTVKGEAVQSWVSYVVAYD